MTNQAPPPPRDDLPPDDLPPDDAGGAGAGGAGDGRDPPKTPPRGLKQPGMARRQKGGAWRRVGEECSLVILAVLFTAVVWYLARENVRSEYEVTKVPVHILDETEGQTHKVELIDTEITVTLYCSERAHLEFRQVLQSKGVEFVRGDSSSGDQRGINEELFNDRLIYPSGVAQYVVPDKTPLPRGRVLKVSSYTIKIDEPNKPLAELAAKGIGVQIVEQPDRQITATLPKNSIGETDANDVARILPDPITPADLGLDEEDLDARIGKEFKVPLSFEDWRAKTDSEGNVYPGRKDVKFPHDAHVVVRLYRDGEAELSNRLIYAVPPQWFERYELRLLEAADLGVSGEGGRELTFTGKIIGTQADLAALEANPRAWHWAIHITAKDEEELDKLDERGSVEVLVSFKLVLHEEFQNRGLKFEASTEQKGEVKLKITKREP